MPDETPLTDALPQVTLAYFAALLVQDYAVYAKHSGIPEIKTVLGGFVMRRFLGTWTLIIKSLGLVSDADGWLSLSLLCRRAVLSNGCARFCLSRLACGWEKKGHSSMWRAVAQTCSQSYFPVLAAMKVNPPFFS